MLLLTEQFKNKLEPMHGYMKGGDSGAGAQADATNRGIDLQREMWQTNMQNLAPFTPLAQQYVGQLQGLSSLQGQQQALGDYYKSGQFQDLSNQARYQQLAASEATGGLGSSATSNGLSSIAPMLGQNWLSGQMNNYQNLANIGMGALTGQANTGQAYANNTGQLLQQQAGLAAANANKPSSGQKFLTGVGAGAAAGSVAGPWGAAAGGAIGGLASLF